jgi:hypothetical protein
MTGAEMRESAAALAEAWADLGLLDDYVPPVPTLDPVGDLPVVTPETWERLRADCGCRVCGVCKWFEAVRMAVHQDHDTYLHREDRHETRDGHALRARPSPEPGGPRWRSVDQALLTFATSGGRLEARGLGGALEQLAEYGQAVQGGKSPDGTSRSDDVVEVERALARALPQPPPEGLSDSDALTIVLARVVGTWARQDDKDAFSRSWSKRAPIALDVLVVRYGVSSAAITALVRRTMKGLRVELGARGLTPMPERGTSAHHDAHARREALCRRR